MLASAYDVLDCLVEARYSTERKPLLVRANLLLERLRFQVRLCADEDLISVGQYEYVSKAIDEVGRLVGVWTKAVDNR